MVVILFGFFAINTNFANQIPEPAQFYPEIKRKEADRRAAKLGR